MEKVRAWELLHDPEYYQRLTVAGVQNLMEQAGYDPEVVQEAMNQRGLERLLNDEVT